MSNCAAPKKSGSPCGGRRLEGSDFCAFHDPKKAKAVAKGRQAGGREATRPPEELAHLPLATVDDVIAMARDAANRVRSNAMGPKQGSAIGTLLNVVLGAMKLRSDGAGDEDADAARPLRDQAAAKLEETYRALRARDH